MIDINRCLQLAGKEVDFRLFGQPKEYVILGPDDWILATGDRQQMVAALNLILSPTPDNYTPPTYG